MIQMYLCEVCDSDVKQGEGGKVVIDGVEGVICPECLRTGKFTELLD